MENLSKKQTKDRKNKFNRFSTVFKEMVVEIFSYYFKESKNIFMSLS